MFRTVDLGSLRTLLTTSEPQLLEVLPEEDYRWAHLPGAANVPLPDLGGAWPESVDVRHPVVVYCNDFL